MYVLSFQSEIVSDKLFIYNSHIMFHHICYWIVSFMCIICPEENNRITPAHVRIYKSHVGHKVHISPVTDMQSSHVIQ